MPEFDFKCPGCKEALPLFGCGTGYSWGLYKCETCSKLTAVGWSNGFIPKEVNNVDFKIQL